MLTSTLFNNIHSEIIGQDMLIKADTIDHNSNGVQLMGSDKDIKKIALGVSCSEEFLQKAAIWGANVCIFHHGLGLSDHYIYNSRLLPSTQKELKIIFENDLSIAGYHYCLDAHPAIGNNAQIIKLLGAKITNEEYFDTWGWIAELENPMDLSDLARDFAKICRHDVFIVKGNDKKVKRVGVCSGGAIPYAKDIWQEIMAKNIEAHLTGVITESSPVLARENGFNYLSAGHYATEVFGIKALAEEIKKKFPQIDVQFIELWNEL